jgi:hypothetical protein
MNSNDQSSVSGVLSGFDMGVFVDGVSASMNKELSIK